jgi:hypothetical protein
LSWIVYLICAVLAAIRIAGAKSETFQAAAHLWMGALIAVWYLRYDRDDAKIAGWLVVVLSVVEVACFVVSRMSP